VSRDTRARMERATGGLGIQERELWRLKIEHLRTDCGCEVGSAVTLAALLAFGLYLAEGGGFASGLSNLEFGIAVLLTSAATGKLLGLLVNRIRLERTLRALERVGGT
jgi:hypothetical protein